MAGYNGQSSKGFGNRQRRHGQSGKRHRKGEPFRRKSGQTLYWRAYHATHGDYNQKQAYGLIILSLVLIGGAGIGVMAPQLIQVYPPQIVRGNHLTARGCVIPCAGAILIGSQQNILLEQFDTGDMSLWSGLCTSYASNFNGAGIKAINLNSNSTCKPHAITKASYDFSGAQAREFFYRLQFILATGGNFQHGWALYFTHNGTLPNTQQYSPYDDPQVALVMEVDPCASPCGLYKSYIQHDGGTKMSAEGIPAICPVAATEQDEFMCQKNTVDWSTTHQEYVDTMLNYTGNGGGGAGSYSESNIVTVCGPCSTQRNSDKPAFPLEGKYFVGVWNDANNGVVGVSTVFIAWATPFVPSPNLPAVDTSGFFGPLVKAFIGLGIYIGQNIITFGSSLVNQLGPILASWINLLSSVIVGIFNAIGGLWGDNSLGTQMAGFISDFTSFLNNAFSNLVGLVALIVTMINNITTFITNFFNTTNFTNLLFGGSGFLGALVNLWTIVNGVWADLAKWFIAGSISAIAILQIDWIIGMLWTAVEPDLKGFQGWLDFNELVIINLFKIAYWLFELGLDVLFKIVMIIKGRVAPFQILAEG